MKPWVLNVLNVLWSSAFICRFHWFSPPEFLVEMGPEGAFVAHYSRGCYSDVGDARLYRELAKEG